MQLKVQHEFASGFSLLTGYTWSKWIDDLTSDSSAPFNPTNLRLNKAVSDLDVPHRFTTAYVWDLPFPEQHDALRYLVNGWRLTGIFQVQSGYPLTPRFAGDVTNTGQETLPDRVCDGKLSNPTPQRWFDTSWFCCPRHTSRDGRRSTQLRQLGAEHTSNRQDAFFRPRSIQRLYDL